MLTLIQSFNDIRLILNTAQVMSIVHSGPLRLVTFDGDVTLVSGSHISYRTTATDRNIV